MDIQEVKQLLANAEAARTAKVDELLASREAVESQLEELGYYEAQATNGVPKKAIGRPKKAVE